MRRRERKRLARSLALLAACICLPIWIVKGCIIATHLGMGAYAIAIAPRDM